MSLWLTQVTLSTGLMKPRNGLALVGGKKKIPLKDRYFFGSDKELDRIPN